MAAGNRNSGSRSQQRPGLACGSWQHYAGSVIPGSTRGYKLRRRRRSRRLLRKRSLELQCDIGSLTGSGAFIRDLLRRCEGSNGESRIRGSAFPVRSHHRRNHGGSHSRLRRSAFLDAGTLAPSRRGTAESGFARAAFGCRRERQRQRLASSTPDATFFLWCAFSTTFCTFCRRSGTSAECRTGTR